MISNDQRDELYEMETELERYAAIEGTEMGELWTLLIQLSRYSDYFMIEGFDEALYHETAAQLQHVKEYAEIVETKETITHTVKTLEWE